MLTCFEAAFELTLEFGEQKNNNDGTSYQEYNVKKMGRNGINTRLTPAELLLMALNPMYREMDFRHLKKLLNETIAVLKKKRPSTEILTKIEFVNGLIKILEQFVLQEEPHKKAYQLFKDYLVTVNPENKRFVIGALGENLYSRVVNKECMEKFLDETQTNCHSGFHTIEDALSFWRNPDSVNDYIDVNIPLIRFSIIRVLSFSKNSSSIERSFAGIKRNSDAKRPRLGTKNMFRQHFLRELRKQNQLFNEYSSNKNHMVEAITFEKRFETLREKLNKIEVEQEDEFEEEEYNSDDQEEELDYKKFKK